MGLIGVYSTTLKNGIPSYRAGITFSGKHISLGSYPTEDKAHQAYLAADELLHGQRRLIDYNEKSPIDFRKYVTLINFRDHGIYIKTPIYLGNKCFYYYLDQEQFLTFDIDDLFYYSTHSIMKRGRHFFVADYGMQVNILSRYGIREHAVCPRDYEFVNGDDCDFRYANLRIINRYHGVRRISKKGKDAYKVFIHIHGDYVVGTYDTEEEAAIAYNKAADILKKKGCRIRFSENYPENLSNREYASIYQRISISEKITTLTF